MNVKTNNVCKTAKTAIKKYMDFSATHLCISLSNEFLLQSTQYISEKSIICKCAKQT